MTNISNNPSTAPTAEEDTFCYWRNSSGHLIPSTLVSDIDKTRDELVLEIARKAKDLRAIMLDFKVNTFADIQAFVELSAEKYGVKLGGIKGNVTLTNFDGRYKLKLSQSDLRQFDERLHAAKQMVNDCIHKWTVGSRVEIKALVEHAFQADKEGNINMARIYSLLQLKIDDEQWQQAMEALRESMQVVATKSYLRLYERNASGNYEQLSLDISGL